MTVVQVALDLTDRRKALEVAEKVSRENIWLEAGTPLIKSLGVSIIKELKTNYPHLIIVADMKTIDAGDVEADLAFSNDADVITVLGLASNATIEKVVEKAKTYGGKVMVDLMEVKDVVRRSLEVKRLGVDIVCLHVGVDVQRKMGVNAKSLTNYVKNVKNVVKGDVAVAGGINDKTARTYVDAGVDILIVGKYITYSSDPLSALRTLTSLFR
ncbi:MAG TPA: hypothetical protein ENF80_05280 [Thermofilum sp.]|nr:hypothetical protein [Thermofilum sp.]